MKKFLFIVIAFAALFSMAACNDSETYADQRNRERDSINAFLKEYNKTHGYSLIFSNTGFDNLLYADSAFNITKEIVDGLNARYSPVKK